MMVLLSIFVVLLVGAVAALATGRLGSGMSVAMPQAVHTTGHDLLGSTEVTRSDLAAVRFDRAARGYRMDQVDAVLDRLGEELARRDERLAVLAEKGQGPPSWPDGDASAPGADGEARPEFSGEVGAGRPPEARPQLPSEAGPRHRSAPGDVD